MGHGQASGRPPEEVYRDLRAAAESGWDFSSRWLEDGKTLSTIRTTELVPVDLNSLMVKLEMSRQGIRRCWEPEKATELRSAPIFETAVRRYLWDPDRGIFTDYVWREEKPSGTVTGATFSALFLGVAREEGRARGGRGSRQIAK